MTTIERTPTDAAGTVNAVEVESVSLSLGGRPILRDVTCSVPRGSLTAIIGPNGAGKTTLLNIMSGIHEADAGTVTIAGLGTLTAGPCYEWARRGIGRSFQTPRVFEDLSVSENISIGLEADRPSARNAGIGRDDRIGRVMDMVGLDSMMGSAPSGSLDFTDRRRLDLARALVANPVVMLLDEPTSGLDVADATEMQDLARRLRDDHTIIFVSHDVSLVMGVADRVIVLDGGTCVFEGATEDVRESEEVRRAYLGGWGG